MHKTQIIGIVVGFAVLLLIPALFVYWVGFGKSKSKMNVLVKLLVAWSYFLYAFYVGMWGFVPYSLRYILLFLLIAASIKSLINFGALPILEKKNVWQWAKIGLQVLLAVTFSSALIQVVNGFRVSEKGIDIAFPLKHGYVGHGGNSTLINYHHADSTAQQYAMDISKLNGWGLRASGFFPEALDKYAIYGDTVFSPCDGKVVKLKDGLDNLPPGTEDAINLAGNHIVLEYDNSLIVFAHLCKNSMMVSDGDSVKKGQPMACVGNSGHTSEPHLHIHAILGTDTNKIIKGGNGIPIYFNGKFLVRNDTW